MVHLAKCLNCGAIMFDENPQHDQALFIAPDNCSHMEQVEENGEYFWACPECRTDAYLIDVISQPENI